MQKTNGAALCLQFERIRALQLQAKLFKALAQHLAPSQKPSGCPTMSLRSIMAIANV